MAYIIIIKSLMFLWLLDYKALPGIELL